ncbi:MAG TPA: hypothetical protein PKE45_02150, partial [Caldilineaceae bacterium]|nr:hypothetical protein [Caldilineaceae bacterium]
MPFEDVLARCIADLERGATVDDCLVNHPDHAQSLEPLLRTVVEFRTGPRPQLSAAAFARGREAVVAKARYHQRLAQPFFSPLGIRDPKWALAAPAMPAPA